MATLVSFGSFYIGTDTESFWDLSLHLGKFRVEWGGPAPLKGGPPQTSLHRRSHGQADGCD